MFQIFFRAPIDSDFYLHLPTGFHVHGEDRNGAYSLKLKNNLYRIRQAAENCFDMLKTGLEDYFYTKQGRSMYFCKKFFYCYCLR